MTTVRFRGLPHIAEGDSFFGEPFGGPLHDGVQGWLPGDEAEFDRVAAEQHGRSCHGTRCETDECSGECYAHDYVDEWNAKFPDLTGDDAPFVIGSSEKPTTPRASESNDLSTDRISSRRQSRAGRAAPEPDQTTAGTSSGESTE